MSDHPFYACSADEAFDVARRNAHRRYPTPERGKDRLYPLTNLAIKPGFEIKSSDTIFAIGSCFARNIEGALHAAGMTVLSRDPDLGPIGDQVGKAANYLNKYTAPSILNDLRWALERDKFVPRDVIYALDDDSHSDPQLGMARLDYPFQEIVEFRTRYLDTLAQAAEADVIILTLGYVETWYDNDLGLYLNIAPPAQLHKLYPGRFSFRVLSYQNVLDSLNEIYDLLTRHRKKPLKMLLTVSPVPLQSTFRNMDVLVANAYSKSVQRAAAEVFVSDKEGVDYFPSYECVTLSNPDIAWGRGDFRHVSSDVVARIMCSVLDAYVTDRDAAEKQRSDMVNIKATARLLGALSAHQDLADLATRHRDVFEQDIGLLMTAAASYGILRQNEAAIDCLQIAVAKAPERPIPLQQLIQLCARENKTELLAALVKRHEDAFPGRAKFRQRYLRVLPELAPKPDPSPEAVSASKHKDKSKARSKARKGK